MSKQTKQSNSKHTKRQSNQPSTNKHLLTNQQISEQKKKHKVNRSTKQTNKQTKTTSEHTHKKTPEQTIK